MSERLDPILPQVPVEDIAVHIGKAGLCMGDTAFARLLPDGRVGIFAEVRRHFLGLIPTRRIGYLGHLGPAATQILAPAMMEGVPLRLRIVLLTPEHLATSGPPEIHVSVWGDRHRMAPFVQMRSLDLGDRIFDAMPEEGPPALSVS